MKIKTNPTEIRPLSSLSVQANGDNFSTEKKVDIVIECIKSRNTSKIARYYGQNESTDRGWKTQFYDEVKKLEEENVEIPKGKAPEGNRTSQSPNMERAVIASILKKREKLSVSIKVYQKI